MISRLPFVDLSLQIQGVLRLEEEEIVLEWRRPKLPGTIFLLLTSGQWGASQLEQVRIPIKELDEIKYRNPFYLFHAALRIRVRSLQTLASVPGANGAEVTLYCKKRDRHLAQEIANLATFRRLEQVFPNDSSPANATN